MPRGGLFGEKSGPKWSKLARKRPQNTQKCHENGQIESIFSQGEILSSKLEGRPPCCPGNLETIQQGPFTRCKSQTGWIQSRNMSESLVSVCIGVFNREGTIRECLDSIFAQTYGNLEVIVADNASTDGTVEIVRSYGPRIRMVRRETNSGMCSTTRNMAVREARGEYIAFLDSDDSWHPEKLAHQIRFMEANPTIPLCHTYCNVMDAESRLLGIRHEGRLPPTGRYFDALLDHCWITISTVMMRRHLYEECGPFTEALPYGRSGEDYEFFLKVARRYEIGLVEEVLANYRKAGEGISGGDWRAVPCAFPFRCCLRKREDIHGGLASPRRLDQMIEHAAIESSQYWRDRGHGWRAVYFPARWLCHRPFWWAGWTEVAKSAFRILGFRWRQR